MFTMAFLVQCLFHILLFCPAVLLWEGGILKYVTEVQMCEQFCYINRELFTSTEMKSVADVGRENISTASAERPYRTWARSFVRSKGRLSPRSPLQLRRTPVPYSLWCGACGRPRLLCEPDHGPHHDPSLPVFDTTEGRLTPVPILSVMFSRRCPGLCRLHSSCSLIDIDRHVHVGSSRVARFSGRARAHQGDARIQIVDGPAPRF